MEVHVVYHDNAFSDEPRYVFSHLSVAEAFAAQRNQESPDKYGVQSTEILGTWDAAVQMKDDYSAELKLAE